MFKIILLSLGLLLISSCGHHRDVRPGSAEEHTVIVRHRSVARASRAAMGQANHFCKSISKHYAAVTKEDSKYVGDISEEDYKMGTKISDVAGVILSPEAQRGKYAADQALGNGYEVDIKFKCL